MKEKTGKVFVGLSGGVDSSVAAYLLKKEGYDVTGVFIRSFNIDGCEEKDAEDARRVAEHLGIPFYVLDFEKEYKKKVVRYMVEGYKRGITPNPDVMCNKEIKFGLFLKKARAMGADYVATGHYVRLERKFSMINDQFSNRQGGVFKNSKIENSLEIGNCKLKIAKDKNKDQSYFLWTLTQDQLRYCLFPIGEYTKPKVREIARKAGLPTAEKKDSQGICFLGQVALGEFLKRYIRPKKGSVVDTNGKKVGEHEGIFFYTIGQRHGLNLGSKNKELGIRGLTKTKPYYVAEKDLRTNMLVVAEGENNPALFRKEIKITDVNFIRPHLSIIHNSKFKIPVLARIRYRQPLVKAVLELGIRNKELGIKGRSLIRNSPPKEDPPLAGKFLILKFDEPIKFVAPGQSAVFYSKKGEMLGGGVII